MGVHLLLQVPDWASEDAKAFAAGNGLTAEKVDALRASLSTVNWFRLCDDRVRALRRSDVEKCLAVRGTEHSSGEKLDAVITLLAMKV